MAPSHAGATAATATHGQREIQQRARMIERFTTCDAAIGASESEYADAVTTVISATNSVTAEPTAAAPAAGPLRTAAIHAKA